MLSPALPDPHQASAGHVYQPPPPPLEAVHCITRKPGWKVLPDLSQIFPLFLVLLSGATHNEAPFSVTGLTTLEKSAARLKDLNAIQSLSAFTLPWASPERRPRPCLVGPDPSFGAGPRAAHSQSFRNGLPAALPRQEGPSP